MSEDREKHARSSLKDEIVGVLKHDEVHALIQRFLAHSRSSHKLKVLINAAVMFLGFSIGIGAFYLAYQSSANQAKVATERAYDQERASTIETIIQRKIEWLKKIEAAGTNMRNVRYQIILQCRYGKPIADYQQAVLRWNALITFINAFSGSKFIFGDALEKKCFELTAFDESVKDVCAKNAPRDAIWREYLTEIDNIMGQSIEKDQMKLGRLDK